jgi:protein-S-isoprenylcysteine O-methyltransferase Ste14
LADSGYYRYFAAIMRLQDSMAARGRWLFRYRGQLPLILFVMAVPAVYSVSVECTKACCCWCVWKYVAFSLSILGFLIRFYTVGTTPRGTSGRNTKEQVAEELNTTGIYSLVRHPLYLGNFLIWLGLVVFTFSPAFTIIFCLMYWLYYERIMLAEEHFLFEKFGASFLNWSTSVPAFIPRFNGFVSPKEPFYIKQVLRREYSGVLSTVVGFVFVEMLRGYFSTNTVDIPVAYLYTLYVMTGLTLLLRSLKHYTKVLD